MKKFITMIVTLVVTLFTVNAFAWSPPPSPAPASWISDTSHVLTDDAHARLDAKLKQINQSSANEVAALILPTLDSQSIEDIGDLTAKAWGVGKKNLDNGVLVVLAMKEHKSRISTGKGVEGDLPDLKCNDILQAARPYLRKGDIEGALGFIFDNAASSIANHKAEAAAQATHTTTDSAPVTQPSTTAPASRTACAVAGGAVGSDSSLNAFFILMTILAISGTLIYLSVRRRLRREQEELETQERLRMERAQTRRSLEDARFRRERQESSSKSTPVVDVPAIPLPRPVMPVIPPLKPLSSATIASAGIASVTKMPVPRPDGQDRKLKLAKAAEDRRRQERVEDERRRREQEEDNARRRRREEESSSSSSSSSSWDTGSSWGGGSDSGGSGGFGGGDSGGGGSSSDW